MKKNSIFKVTFSSIMIAMAMVLPFLTGQIPEIGAMLCPLHIPVIICGIICGCKYGAVCGFIIPILRSIIFGMPPMYPTAITMSFELLTYGFVCGILFNLFKKKNMKLLLNVYLSLIIAMILGRLVWGIVRYIISIFDGSNVLTFKIFITSTIFASWPGIVLQLVLIPTLICVLYKAKLLRK